MKATVPLLGMLCTAVVWAAPTAGADAGCEPRSASHVAEHGGLTADSAWHVAHGERPTCDPNPKASESKRDNDKHDDKSRYCKRKWYC